MAQGRDGNFEEGRITKVMLPIPIYKGDSTDAFGVRVIKINLKTELVLTNATATFTLLSFKKNFTSAELATKVLTITIPADVTKGFPLGNVYGKLCLYDSSLRVLTAACHIPFRVELAGSGIYGGWCAERTPLAEITVEAGVDYALAYNKPTINNVVVDGDKTAADYGLALLSQIPTMLSQLQSDATHRTVTDAEKAQWNAGSSIPDLDTIRANAQLGANHSRLRDNPHQVSKSQVGLGNVDNTSDANKPVSTAQQTALNNKVDKVSGKGLSERDFTASDKTKLDGIETGAQKNVNANWTSSSGSAGFIQNKPKCEIADLPEEFTEDEMRTKLNALLGWMRTNFAVLSVGILMAASAYAEPVVQKARKGSIPNTTEIVTDVTGLSDLASKQSVTASVGYTTAVSNKLEAAIASATPGDYYNVSNNAYTALQQSDILNVTSSTATNKALSANMGRDLQEQIQNLKQRGRYLSVWNATNGLAETSATVSPYPYKSGDYFIVGSASATNTIPNYRPVGSEYTNGVPSRVVEPGNVVVNDTYYFDGTSWSLLHTEQKEVAFSTLAGSPYDNASLSNALYSKQGTISDYTTTNAVNAIITNHVTSGYIASVVAAQGMADAAEASAKSASLQKETDYGNVSWMSSSAGYNGVLYVMNHVMADGSVVAFGDVAISDGSTETHKLSLKANAADVYTKGEVNTISNGAVVAATNAAVAQAMAQADGKFVGYSLVEDSRQIADEYEITVPWSFAGGLYSFISFDGYETHGIQFVGSGAMIKTTTDNFIDFYASDSSKSRLNIDGSPVATSNMVDSMIIPKVSNSDNLWNQSNAKLTTRINEVSAPIAASANLAIATANNVSNRQDTLEGYIAGQRVRVSVTNYYGNTSGQLPRMRIEEFVTATNVTGGVATETNYWQVVWDEQNKYDRFLAEAKTAISAMTNNLYQTYYALLMERLNTKAPRAWGTLTSAGEAAPAGSVWHTEPNTVFAGGTEYAHAMVGTGVIGVLTTRGAAVYTDGETGRFHFTTDDKQYYFGMNIATRYELGCATDGITVTTVGGNNMVDLLYNVTMTGKPILYYTPSISGNSVVWEQITDSAGGAIPGATVYAAWDQAPPAGSEICTINCGAGVSGFFKASVEYAGSSKFETNMMADLMGGIIATNQTSGQSQPVEPYISNGSVLWRIKQ